MSWLGEKLKGLKNAVFGTEKEVDERKVFAPWGARNRLDQGPATAKYVKRLFPRSIFTKKMTPQRERYIHAVMRRLRPEQRLIAIRRGYTKGLYK